MKYKEGETFRTIALAASQTFLAGAPAILATDDNTVEEGGADPASIVGFFLADAEDYAWMYDTFGTVVPAVPVALANAEFRGTLKGTYAKATDVIGKAYGLVKDASGYWTVDKADTTNTRVTITGIEDGVANGDIDVPIRFVVLPANRAVIG